MGDQLAIKKSDLSKQKFTFLMVDESAKVRSHNSTHVAISLSMVSMNATWYQYDVSGTNVRFIVIADPNGTIHSALDSCWKSGCVAKHMGFRNFVPGVTMVENCCNMAFAVKNMTEAGCSIMMCHPVYLPNQVVGDQVMFAISDLEAGASLFAS